MPQKADTGAIVCQRKTHNKPFCSFCIPFKPGMKPFNYLLPVSFSRQEITAASVQRPRATTQVDVNVVVFLIIYLWEKKLKNKRTIVGQTSLLCCPHSLLITPRSVEFALTWLILSDVHTYTRCPRVRERRSESSQQTKAGRQRWRGFKKCLWVDFHRTPTPSSVNHVCTSKDADRMQLLFDLTCAVFLIRTSLGSEAVLVPSLL